MATRLQELIQLVRAYLRDYPELNRLIQGSETGDRSLALAIASTVEDFNLSSPLSPYTIEAFPSTHLIILGAAKHVLESASFLQARNHLSYSDGQGIQVNESDKAPLYLNIVQKLAAEYEARKQALIVRMNIAQCMDPCGVKSDFSQSAFSPTLEIDLIDGADE